MQAISTSNTLDYMVKSWCSRCVHNSSKNTCCAIFAEVPIHGLPDEWVKLEGKGLTCTMFSSQKEWNEDL